VLDDIDDVTSLLTCLKIGRVRKLLIRECELTTRDVALIKQIRSLEVLDLRGVNGASLVAELSLLSELPNLKRVSLPIEHDIGQPGAPLKPLPRLEKLVIAYAGADQALMAKNTQALRDRLRVPPAFNKHTDFVVESADVGTPKSWFLPWDSAKFDL
jgi:hypothetical protein